MRAHRVEWCAFILINAQQCYLLYVIVMPKLVTVRSSTCSDMLVGELAHH